MTEALKITHWAETHYINIVPHNPLGPVSAAACVSLCMASSNVGVQEMPKAPGTYAQKLFPKQIEWEDGYSWCPDTPGLGVDIDMDVAESMRELIQLGFHHDYRGKMGVLQIGNKRFFWEKRK